ncbi:MAG: RnfABCDGE type electron transport complex subunit G [Treponema sp.]|jgi:electron transport complex protein RnfG|nr:RnfABCDGE type electron transport complex subunit G [Treponema sp.]
MKEKAGFLGMAKLGLVLAIFAAAACVMLAFVYNGTQAVIAQRQQSDLQAALKDLFPDADNFEKIDSLQSPDVTVTIENAYAALKNGNAVGAALRLSRASYGGAIKTMTGVSADGRITGVKIMEHSDTPGLGANAASPKYYVDRANLITFYGQFAGKNVIDPFRAKDDVAAITASTVTSQAVASSVKAAGIAVTAWLAGEEVDAVSGASEGWENE